jgi:predicted DCC family thiol-disulfide oxidoreductase YuxK
MHPNCSFVVFVTVLYSVMCTSQAFHHVVITPSATSTNLLSTSSSATMNETNNNKTPDVSSYSSSSSSLLLDPKTVSTLVFANDKRPVILFDGVCNMCNSAVNLALDWDPKGYLRFSALQSNVGRALLEANGRKADDISSIVLVTKDGAFVKSDAVLKITEELMPTSLLPLKPAAVVTRLLIPKFLRDIIYDNVADNRYQIMGKRIECRLDSGGAFEDRFVDDSIATKR